jgi:hypothetical protein
MNDFDKRWFIQASFLPASVLTAVQPASVRLWAPVPVWIPFWAPVQVWARPGALVWALEGLSVLLSAPASARCELQAWELLLLAPPAAELPQASASLWAQCALPSGEPLFWAPLWARSWEPCEFPCPALLSWESSSWASLSLAS